MVMQVAKWRLVMRVENNALPGNPATTAARRFHRQELDNQITREREGAYNRWLLLGGASNR